MRNKPMIDYLCIPNAISLPFEDTKINIVHHTFYYVDIWLHQ